MSETSISIQRFTFVRHGESVGNLEKRFQGHADFPLTELGRSQALTLARQWKKEGRRYDRAISSPLSRARETAEIICTILNIPLELDPAWMEINNGRLAGLDSEEAAEAVPEPVFMTPYTHFGETGESRWELFLRAGSAIQHLMDQPISSTLVVAHGGILNMTMYSILGIPLHAHHNGPRFEFHNAAFADFTYDVRQHSWRLHAFTSHPVKKD